MTTPGRLLDFFTLEAGEYLTRLESLATRESLQPADAFQFAAAARGLRGSATMAKAGGLARLATSVERIASAVVQGAISWEPELQRSLVGAIEDLKLLVRSVRQWGAEQDSRVMRSAPASRRCGPSKRATPVRSRRPRNWCRFKSSSTAVSAPSSAPQRFAAL